MGAWGHNTFDNDSAMDWVADLEESEGTSALIDAFDLEDEDDDEGYLDSDIATVQLAACEVVAALLGHPAEGLPEEVSAWVRDNPIKVNANLLKKARNAIEGVRNKSELKDLWEESGESKLWYASVDNLMSRLKL